MKTLTKGIIATMLLGATTVGFAQMNPQNEITMQQAKEIALKKAGFGENEVKWLDIQYDYEHGRGEYEVEFKKGSMEYEYDIDSKTGEIRSMKIEENKWFD